MPLVRVEVRNEYGLGAPEMYMDEANNDEPKKIMEGVAVSGLVGLLRQLGDLADFAADVFHGLQEDVTITCSRSYKLMARVQWIEAALIPVEKAVLAQRSHLHFAYTAGVNWHAPGRCEKNHFVYSDMPQFILDSYEDCRNPPHFHLLDRFDPSGPGSCLKRYSDPTLFINASKASGDASTQKVSRDMKVHKTKKRMSWSRNGEGSRDASFSCHSVRMQFPQSSVGGHTSPFHPISTYYAALKTDLSEQSNLEQRNGSGCSKDDVCPSYSMQPKEQEYRGFISSRQRSHGSDDIKINLTQDQGVCSSYSYTSGEKTSVIEPAMEDYNAFSSVQTSGSGVIHLDEFGRETDHFKGAPKTIERESITDIYCLRKQDLDHFSKLEKTAASGRVPAKDEYNSVSSADKSFLSAQMTGDSLNPSSKKSISSSGNGGITKSTNKESISCRVSSDFSGDGRGMPIIGDTKSSHEPEKPVPETSDVTSVAFWTNGGMLGLQPSKPPLCSVLSDLPQCCLSNEDEKSSSTRQVIFHDRDPRKPDETNSFQKFQDGLDMDSATCQEYQESDVSLREKFWKKIPADADVKLGRSGNLLHPHYANSTGASVSGSRSFLPVKSEFEAARNHPEIAGSSSSPPLAHMKISVQPMDGYKTKKLKLRFIDGDIINNQGNIDIFPTFQLVPEVSSTQLNVDSDSDDYTCSRSSSSLSDDFHIHEPESNSGQRESSGKDPDLYDSFRRISLAESISTVDLKSDQLSRKDSNSKEPLEPGYATGPDHPPLPPVQWWAMKPHQVNTENSCDAMPKASRSAIDIKHSASSSSQQNKPVPTHHDLNMETANENRSKPFSSEKSNSRREANHIHGKSTDGKNFLNQIRSKSLSLRRTLPAKPIVPAGISTNVQIMTILEKANAIRQAVGSDDGDNWSDC